MRARVAVTLGPPPRSDAVPKSRSLTWASWFTRILLGFRSRCRIRLRWAYSTASVTWRNNRSLDLGGGRLGCHRVRRRQLRLIEDGGDLGLSPRQAARWEDPPDERRRTE